MEKFPKFHAGTHTQDSGNFQGQTRINIERQSFPRGETVSWSGNLLFPRRFPRWGRFSRPTGDPDMPIAGVSHCPACHAVVNIQWATCVVCSQLLKVLNKPSQNQWIQAWEALAQATNNIDFTDPRFKPVMSALDSCDLTFEQGDWLAFKLAAAQVRAAVRLSRQGKE